MKRLLSVISGLLLAGCVASGFEQYYTPVVSMNQIPGAIALQEGEKPTVLTTNNFLVDLYTLRSRKYIPIGYSDFNGAFEDVASAVKQAEKVGATTVLITSEYSGTQTIQGATVMPTASTSYTSGTVSGTTNYSSPYAGLQGSSSTTGTYSGSTTTYGTQVIPYMIQQRRYDQTAVYLVYADFDTGHGVFCEDIPSNIRLEVGRNTGAFITLVFEDSPAFFANVLPGDIVVGIDGQNIKSCEHATQVMDTLNPALGSAVISVLREGGQTNLLYEF